MAVVVAGVTAAATVVIGAGAASAATPQMLCVYQTDFCASVPGSPAIKMIVSESPFDWLYNGPDHGPGQIQLSLPFDVCMQLDHAAGNIVIGAKCNGASYQSWQAIAIAGTFPESFEFQSQWDKSQCLTYNQDKAWLDTVACKAAWYQTFTSL